MCFLHYCGPFGGTSNIKQEMGRHSLKKSMILRSNLRDLPVDHVERHVTQVTCVVGRLDRSPGR